VHKSILTIPKKTEAKQDRKRQKLPEKRTFVTGKEGGADEGKTTHKKTKGRGYLSLGSHDRAQVHTTRIKNRHEVSFSEEREV